MENFKKIRKSFLDFFESKGHKAVASSSLIPDDVSVLLTTAGMQQFKRYYLGELDANKDFGSSRTVSIQKCFRTSDIEEVGDDIHLTFFEMMGNFSFGPVGDDDPKDFSGIGYFKRSSIVWAYEFLTERLEINPENIYVTVFEGDEKIPKDSDSYLIWKDEVGIDEKKIFFGSKKDNFWGPTGSQGPCGPTSEIYLAKNPKEAEKGNGIEIWNIVFNEYFGRVDLSGVTEYEKIKNFGIDTGMGFERLSTILEGKNNVYETSVFKGIIDLISEISPQSSKRDVRILADHIRSSVFLIADGVLPSNKEVGYILRRLLRKIIALKIKNDIHSDIFEMVYQKISDLFGDIYNEIKDEKLIVSVWREETEKFQESINKGIKEISKLTKISGVDAFNIYQTFGLPFELIKEFAPKSAVINLDEDGFERELRKHQEVSRAGVEKKFGGHGLLVDTGEIKAGSEDELKKTIRLHTATHILQWALREVLGDGVKQMGSDINSERLRFDFSFERKLENEEIKRIEDLINEKIKKDLPVYFKEMKKDEAEDIGALSFFKEKYPEIVKVYFIGSQESGGVMSKEFCGGPHVNQTLEIGKFKILKEESVGRGVRRIRGTVEDF